MNQKVSERDEKKNGDPMATKKKKRKNGVPNQCESRSLKMKTTIRKVD